MKAYGTHAQIIHLESRLRRAKDLARAGGLDNLDRCAVLLSQLSEDMAGIAGKLKSEVLTGRRLVEKVTSDAS